MQRELEDELRRRRDPQLAARERRHHVQVLFNRLENRVRVQLHVPHDFREHVPLDLREGEKEMFIRQQCVFTPTGFFDCPVDDALCGFADLAW